MTKQMIQPIGDNQPKLRCVLFGLGNQAQEHLLASLSHPDIDIIAGIDSSTAQWEAIRTAYPTADIQFFDSLEALLSSSLDFDAFIMALPHHAYQPIWSDILRCNKPILKEKPLGRNYQEARQFMQQASDAHCGLMTAIQRRTHPSYVYLAQYLSDHKLVADEVHVHLHLGKGQVNPSQSFDLGWRGDRIVSGGGALLDAGYHMIDILMYLIGDFDIVAATMWHDEKVDNGIENEDRSWLMARSQNTWIGVDIWVKGEPNNKGGYKKSERIVLKCGNQHICANREGVWVDDEQIYHTSREWQQAMAQQLTDFSTRIRHDRWDDNIIWDQLPIMLKIEQAYALSSRY
ncbi:Gfo/Idh/MocA family protein [Psychrobacter jeotgali]|uniref:Gfo/Idh/MocA family protein n=1 Tax=Psychrobacter jeotgali TaxID=179010 RepID=UPI001917A653|nr:Gfo/Idh/MocA family oxidoreductase [Psychrobacter jeotgali]